MGVRELKEQALELYAQRRFAECARTYEKLLELEPRDPHLHMRHAEACRRAGERWKAIAAYRTAAELLRQLGCDARARAALRVAQELDPRAAEAGGPWERRTPALLTPVTPPAAERHRTQALALRADGMGWKQQAPEREPAAPPSSAAEVRRLSDNTLAIRTAPGTRWWVVSSSTALTAYEVEDLERVEVPRESSYEVTYVLDP